MGTSSNRGGSGSNSPLVPPHADPYPDQPLPDPIPHRFQTFRKSIGDYVSGGKVEDRDKALGRYARNAVGGSSVGFRRFGTSSTAGANLISAFSWISAGTAPSTTEQRTLHALIGQSIENVAQALSDALAPEGESRDAIRTDIQEAICETLSEQATFNSNLVDDDFLISLLLHFLTQSIFTDIWNEAGASLDRADPNQLIKRENQLRDEIRAAVDNCLSSRALSNIHNLTQQELEGIQHSIIQDVLATWEALEE